MKVPPAAAHSTNVASSPGSNNQQVKDAANLKTRNK